MPTVGTSQFKLTSSLSDIDQELLEAVEGEPGKKQKHSTPELSDNESPRKRLKETASVPHPNKCKLNEDLSLDIDFDCQCGETGYGHVDDQQIAQRALMCEQCRHWSHLACTKGITHPDVQSFICHKCAPTKKEKKSKEPIPRRSNRM